MKNKTSITHKARHIFYGLLRAVINFQLSNNLCENHNKFKRGDWLKYNWKAKIIINTVVKREGNKPRQFEKYIISGDNVEFINGDSCSAFWVRRLHFWERHP
jgi:hypothetical protein